MFSLKMQLVHVTVPPPLLKMAPPCHGGARENGRERASRAAGATYILSCKAERHSDKGERGATRENGGERAVRAAGATYSLSCEADRQATRGKGDA